MIIVCDYVMLPVKKETKELVDVRRKEMGAKTYDEAVHRLASRGVFHALKPFEGILKGTPEFVRDKRERKLD